MKIYISGPMTGYEKFNYPAFNRAEENLWGMGYSVFNPASIVGEDDWGWADYMRECIAEIPKCTHIYLLNGWESSRGANIELFIANTLKFKVMYEHNAQLTQNAK